MNLDSSLDGDIFNALNQLGKSSYWNELRQGLVNQGETNQWFLHTVYHRIRDIPFFFKFSLGWSLEQSLLASGEWRASW